MIPNTSVNDKLRLLKLSLLVWLIFISYEILFSYLITGTMSTVFDYFTSYTINIGLFYFNALFILPRCYKKRYYYGVILILGEFIIYVLLKYAIALSFFYHGESKINPLENFTNYFVLTVWRYIYFMGLSIGYWFSRNVMVQRKKISELEKNSLVEELNIQILEKKLVASDLAYLKSQINPHFLFNSLNYIYNSSVEITPKLGIPIALLSDIMNYALAEVSDDGKVFLQEEITQIESCIELYRLRYDQQIYIEIAVNGNIQDFRIPPLILITAIENMFKYGDHRNSDDPSFIKVSITESSLDFTTRNKKLNKKTVVRGKGIGLKNLRSRLDVYYPGGYNIYINDDENIYSFNLSIRI